MENKYVLQLEEDQIPLLLNAIKVEYYLLRQINDPKDQCLIKKHADLYFQIKRLLKNENNQG